MKKIIESEIKTLNTEYLSDLIIGSNKRYARRFREVEREPYKLLCYLALQYTNGLFFDVGTKGGASALALGSNKSNKVISWDIDITSRVEHKYAYPNVETYPNIEFRVKNIFEEHPNIYNSADIIYLDIDPHDGLQEKQFIDMLDKTLFSGILILDDIDCSYFPELRKFWLDLDKPKYEIPYAHGSGTGVLSYGEEIENA